MTIYAIWNPVTKDYVFAPALPEGFTGRVRELKLGLGDSARDGLSLGLTAITDAFNNGRQGEVAFAVIIAQ